MRSKSLTASRLARATALALGAMTATALCGQALAEPNVNVLRTIEKSNTVPASMCFVLNGRHVVSSEIDNLSRYLELRDKDGQIMDGAPSVVNDLLCVGNLNNGDSYSLRFKKGLRMASGDRLNETFTSKFTISDAMPQIRMPYNIILPKSGHNSSFTIKTVNQPAVKVAIFRIPAASLRDVRISDLMTNEVSFWNASQLFNYSFHPVYERVFDLSDGSSTDIMDLKIRAAHKAIRAQAAAEKTVPVMTADPGLASQSDLGEAASSEAADAVLEAQRARIPEKMLNKPQEIKVSLKDFVSSSDDGMYFVVAADPRIDFSSGFSWQMLNDSVLPFTTRFMVITNLGVSTYSSRDGILASVRSLTSAKSLKNVDVELVATNGEVLGKARTDKEGTVRFGRELTSGKMSLAPSLLRVSTDKDFYLVDLQSSPFYLEDNTGLVDPGKYSAYAWTERGIYRPGETIHYTALVRNSRLEGLSLPLTLTMYNSLGSEVHKTLLSISHQGGYEYDFDIPSGTPTGRYTAVLSLGKQKLSETAFNIGAYVPAQIKGEIVNNDSVIGVNVPFRMKARAMFNYGGAASSLNGNMVLDVYPDEHPVPSAANAARNKDLKRFHFGPDKSTYESLRRSFTFYNLKTDVEGVLQQSVTVPDADYPRSAVLKSTVFDTNGQAVNAKKNFKIAFNRPVIGVRQLSASEAGKAVSDSDAAFALCSYLQDGSTFPQDVRYFVYRQYVDYNYVFENGVWRYVQFFSRNLVNQGTVKVDNQKIDAPSITLPLDDGSYVLELESEKSRTSLNFIKGFKSSGSADTPDRVELFADKKEYSPGDEARLSFYSPFDGYANLAMGNKGISSFKTFRISKGHNEVKVKITDEFYPQGHALLSIFSPINEDQQGSVRAVGLVDLNMDMTGNRMEVSTEVPDEIKPQSELKVKITARPEGAKPEESKGAQEAGNDVKPADGSGGWARVALVDNGILSLTSYKAPNPNSWFMKDRAYDVSLRDPYGLIMTDPGQRGQGYDGGDEAFMAKASGVAAMENVPYRTIALASKIVPLNASGEAEVAFDVPQFAGSLKVMTVAWDNSRTGADSEDVTVRDKAVATLGLPRYLNIGDTVSGRLNLHNLKARNTEFKVDISCSGAVRCSTQTVSNLKPGIREDQPFDIKAIDTGTGTIDLKVINPDFNFKDSYQLQVTEPVLPSVKSLVRHIEPGKSITIKVGRLFRDMSAGMISWSQLPDVNPEAFVRSFNQQGSSSLGDLCAALEGKLLYGRDFIATDESLEATAAANTAQEAQAAAPLYASEGQYNDDIQSLIFRISAQQRSSGTFGPAVYDSIYAADLLLRADELGFKVNDSTVQNCLNMLRGLTSDPDSNAVYAYEVLSRRESVNQADVRQLLDSDKVERPQQLAHLANTLVNLGDNGRAQAALDKAVEGLMRWQTADDKRDSGKRTLDSWLEWVITVSELAVDGHWNLREAAFTVIDAAVRQGRTDLVAQLVDNLHELRNSPDYLSSMTMAAMMRASAHLDGRDDGGRAPGAESSKSANFSALLSAEDMKVLMTPVKSDKPDSGKSAKDGSTAGATAEAGTDEAGKNADQSSEKALAKADSASKAGKDGKAAMDGKGAKGSATSADAPASAAGPLYGVEPGILTIYNRTERPLFANTSILGTAKKDRVIANKGFGVTVNYWTRGGAVDLSTYEFRPNEEVLMEVFVDPDISVRSPTIVRARIPAGFEYVRTLKDKEDPVFAPLFKPEDNTAAVAGSENESLFTPSSVETGDDQLVAIYPTDRAWDVPDNWSLFVVLRAAHSGSFRQGETMVQVVSDPGWYGTSMGTQKIEISAR
ncbi:MG2 domain-containing protein [Anaerobiospirillum sp. NML120449]|uniref:alpha-2-macroglobulin family protein n=1 Tax=Anaerobiospirillum sp. NML120449 TaxID=2932817 RepID=UPI001FF43276|nr:MG2 domain-containing protein [Anaerobiospirillum sp. NML120449]MCK0527367.1 MG2 domain-containing protein [Anaerobiospirillum sp. NML120449]